MSENPEVMIQGNFTPVPKVRKPTILDWVKYYLYNLSRKPLLYFRKKELIKIYDEVRLDLEKEVLPVLFENLKTCTGCKDAYFSLINQVFLSQIESIVMAMCCDEHPEVFIEFQMRHLHNFKRSEQIAAWIVKPSS